MTHKTLNAWRFWHTEALQWLDRCGETFQNHLFRQTTVQKAAYIIWPSVHFHTHYKHQQEICNRGQCNQGVKTSISLLSEEAERQRRNHSSETLSTFTSNKFCKAHLWIITLKNLQYLACRFSFNRAYMSLSFLRLGFNVWNERTFLTIWGKNESLLWQRAAVKEKKL